MARPRTLIRIVTLALATSVAAIGAPAWAGASVSTGTSGVSAEVSQSTAAVKGYAVILGDSYSSGEGAGWGTTVGYLKSRPGCDVHKFAYGNFIGFGTVTNLACQGAKYDNLVVKSQTVDGHTYAPQLDQLKAVVKEQGGSPKVVVFTIGGNDIGFSKILSSCWWASHGLPNGTCDALLSLAESQLNIQYFRVRNIIRDVNRIAPGAMVVVLGYPELFSQKALSCPIEPKFAKRIGLAARAMNAQSQSAAWKFGAYFVSVKEKWSGNLYCDGNSGNDWLVPLTAKLLGTREVAHPKADAYSAEGQLIRTCISGPAACRAATKP